MKNLRKVLLASLVFVFTLVLVGCGKKSYDEYLGYQFSGKDPWGNELAVTIRTLEEDKLTWTFTDVVGEGETSLTLYNELTTDFKDDKTTFTVKGNADATYTYEYTGTLKLADGKLTITFEKGALTSNSPEGGSSSHQVEALEETNRTITLTKVVDNA